MSFRWPDVVTGEFPVGLFGGKIALLQLGARHGKGDRGKGDWRDAPSPN